MNLCVYYSIEQQFLNKMLAHKAQLYADTNRDRQSEMEWTLSQKECSAMAEYVWLWIIMEKCKEDLFILFIARLCIT